MLDDDSDFAEGVELLFRDARVSSKSFKGAQEFLDALPKLRPGCVFVDLAMPGMNGLDLLRQLRAAGCRWPAVILTGNGSAVTAADAMRAGAFAFLEKPPCGLEVLATAQRARADLNGDIQTMHDEEVARRIQGLSRRERDVFDGVLQGLRNKQIAGRLGVSESTVKSARRVLMMRMRARSRVELTTLALRGGMTIKARS